MKLPRSSSLVVLVVLVGCQQYPEISDYGQLCVSAQEVDGEHRLVVDANSGDCAGDHEGASFECSITADGLVAQVETVFQDGKDPNDACNGALETTCEVTVEAGTYTIEFAGEQRALIVPGGEPTCFPEGSSGTDG